MRRVVLLATTATAVLLALASSPCAGRATSTPTLRVRLQPSVVRLGQEATIVASGAHSASVEVRLSGATDFAGRPLPWTPLRLDGTTWRGILPAPALRGVYPVEIRTGADASPLRPAHVFLRVLARGALTRPAFDNPVDVVRWWVRTVPRGTLVAFRPWPRSAYDRRDVRLQERFVVAYSPPGHPDVADRLGMFVAAFRDGYDGPWRLLEATVEP